MLLAVYGKFVAISRTACMCHSRWKRADRLLGQSLFRLAQQHFSVA
jgi:hypothetical protein